MIKCVKTGCVVWLEEYSEWAYGDAFEGEGFFVFRLCQRGYIPVYHYKHFTVHKIAHWWDDQRTSMDVNSTLIAYDLYVDNHGYEGVEIKTA